jgi:hypothetical protein
MFPRLVKYLLVCALMFSIGGHWLVLQSVAWTTMFAANLSNHASASEALSQTFDGEHPCSLCQVVKAGKASEQKGKLPSLTLKKFEYVSESARFIFIAPSFSSLAGSRSELFTSHSSVPPVPPPRGILG